MLSEKSKKDIKAFSEAFAEDIRIGRSDDYGSSPVTATSGYLEVVGPPMFYEDALEDIYKCQRDRGAWKRGKYQRGDSVLFNDKRYVFHVNWGMEGIDVPDDKKPGESDYWAEIVQRPSEAPYTTDYKTWPDSWEQLKYNEKNPCCIGCSRRIPYLFCMLGEKTPKSCSRYTHDKLLVCNECPWWGKKLQMEEGTNIGAGWHWHCFRTSIYADKRTQEHPILNKTQCPFFGLTNGEFYQKGGYKCAPLQNS